MLEYTLQLVVIGLTLCVIQLQDNVLEEIMSLMQPYTFHVDYMQPCTSLHTISDQPDTWVFPTLQIPPLNIRHDSEVTQVILGLSHSLHIASPYMNFTKQYFNKILNRTSSSIETKKY
jgi:hypothetical protein